MMHIFHKWHMWSEPKERAYYHYQKPPALVKGIVPLETIDGLIQERTCSTCGKYQWRKV